MYKIRDSLAEENIKREREDRNFYLFAGILMAIFAVMIALNAFVYYFVAVQGASMQPTLFTGDFLIVNRLKGFGYGDIIIIDGEKENGGVYDFSVEAKKGEDIRREVFKRLAARNWPILSMRTNQLTLEDIFLQLTSEDKSNGGAK